MNREDIIKLAREAGIRDCTCSGAFGCLERFAALVAAAERDARIEAQKRIEALQAENIRNEADRLAAVLNEREACAKVCADLHIEGEDDTGLAADLIRARSNT